MLKSKSLSIISTTLYHHYCKKEDMVSESAYSGTNVKIGDRVECSGFIGTVKYIGPVETHSSNWLGIDWDDQFRGKHDGTVNGVQYFNTRFPKSGSFVRPEKVELGQSIIASIIDRYGKKENELNSAELQRNLYHFQQSINAPFLEMVGFEKVLDRQSDFHTLRVVNLRLQNINSSSESGQLQCLCPNIQELDLSKNLISSWFTVFEICTELEYLYWLNLSENYMSIPDSIKDHTFPSIGTLICTAMSLSWEDVRKISIVFPNVTELRVPFNHIQNLDTPTNILQNLKILDIENNLIENWSEICKLTILENLEELFVGNVGLRKIEFNGNQSKVDTFKNLKKLSISHNLIDNWESINELNRMQNLEDLRCIKNPILETQTEANRFQIIVARIGNLKVFNGAEIKSDIRKGAEYDYLKMYGLEWLSVKDTSKNLEFLKLHNRYAELVEMYGAPEESELLIKPKSISSTLVNLDLVYENKTISRKLPQTILVQKLMLLVQKIFHLKYRPNLTYVSADDANFKIPLEDHRDIGFYSMQNGDKIVVIQD